jgi:phosphatidylserine synthase
MQLRWTRFWIGMDLLLGAWIVALFWLAFHGYSHWWWPGLGLCFLYVLLRYSVLAIDHVRAWRLWALFDFAVWAIVGAMAFASEVGNPWAFWGLGLLLAHFAFVKWRARRWPRHL